MMSAMEFLIPHRVRLELLDGFTHLRWPLVPIEAGGDGLEWAVHLLLHHRPVAPCPVRQEVVGECVVVELAGG